VSKLLKEKGVVLNYGGFVKMYGNYLILHPQPDNSQMQALESHKAAKAIIDDIIAKKQTAIPKSRLLYSLMYAMVAPNFKKEGQG